MHLHNGELYSLYKIQLVAGRYCNTKLVLLTQGRSTALIYSVGDA
jgi:hypothetical protein